MALHKRRNFRTREEALEMAGIIHTETSWRVSISELWSGHWRVHFRIRLDSYPESVDNPAQWEKWKAKNAGLLPTI